MRVQGLTVTERVMVLAARWSKPAQGMASPHRRTKKGGIHDGVSGAHGKGCVSRDSKTDSEVLEGCIESAVTTDGKERLQDAAISQYRSVSSCGAGIRNCVTGGNHGVRRLCRRH